MCETCIFAQTKGVRLVHEYQFFLSLVQEIGPNFGVSFVLRGVFYTRRYGVDIPGGSWVADVVGTREGEPSDFMGATRTLA